MEKIKIPKKFKLFATTINVEFDNDYCNKKNGKREHTNDENKQFKQLDITND